ncbi:MAG: peptidase [Bdellovibrionales bacterium]|nr:peptidase [Bdellovibrionales bacterium]
MKHLKTKLKKKEDPIEDSIVIDQEKGLIFSSEEELYQHFFQEIETLESQYFEYRRNVNDIPESEFGDHEDKLGLTLEVPDEVWKAELIEGHDFHVYIKVFGGESESDEVVFYTAVAYLTHKIPSFVYLHFPSREEDLVDRYRVGELVFSRAQAMAAPGAIDGDALGEGDDFAIGLYEAMLMVRGARDITEEHFKDYAHLREESVEQADEIWRSDDSMGNVLVNFIKEFPDERDGQGVFYIVVTIEDIPSNSHALLFSFPTCDHNLVDRYRHGENLQADEVTQEASH